jgi:hypothetical protein
MEKKIVVFKTLHETCKTMGLPVEQIESTGDFTINSLKDIIKKIAGFFIAIQARKQFRLLVPAAFPWWGSRNQPEHSGQKGSYHLK